MVSETKVQIVKEVGDEISRYPVVGVIDMYKLPGKQLYNIRNSLRGKATIKMVKKRLIIRALENSKMENIKWLEKYVQGSPALIMSETDPFDLARIISKSKSKAPAKPGDIAPFDIVIRQGPTNLPPGPAIGELQKFKIPSGVEGDKIVVKKDTVVVKEGEEISKELAGLLGILGFEPMEIGLNLLALWEKGVIYEKEILFISQERYIEDLQQAYSEAFNLSLNIGYPTKDTMPLLLSKAHSEAVSLAMEAGIETEETIGPLMAKAKAQADALKEKVKEPEPEAKEEKAEERPKEEKKEEPKEEVKEEKTKEPEKKVEEKPKEEKKPTEEKKEKPAEEEKQEKQEEQKPEAKSEEKKEGKNEEKKEKAEEKPDKEKKSAEEKKEKPQKSGKKQEKRKSLKYFNHKE